MRKTLQTIVIPPPQHVGHTLTVFEPAPDEFLPGAYRLVCSCGEATWLLGQAHHARLGTFSPYEHEDQVGRVQQNRVNREQLVEAATHDV